MGRKPALGRVALLPALAAALCIAHGAEAIPEPPKPARPTLRGPAIRTPPAELKKLDGPRLAFAPDLAIRSLRLKSYGPCRAYAATLTFEVVLANTGNAPSSGIGGAGIVKVAENNGAGPWAGGAGGNQQIPPGGQITVNVPVYYFQANPAHMVRGAPHRFRAEADPLKRIAEKNESNNLSSVVLVGAPPDCPGADRPRAREQPGLRQPEIRRR